MTSSTNQSPDLPEAFRRLNRENPIAILTYLSHLPERGLKLIRDAGASWNSPGLRSAGRFLSTAAFCLILSGAPAAEDRPTLKRRLALPDKPYNYARTALPGHFKDVASRFDNTPSDNPITDAGATLGRVLFHDRTLSRNGTTSCASCHKQERAFTDDARFSTGFDGEKVSRNSMSLVNVRYYQRGRFFWDERAATLEQQVLIPIENKTEMGHSLPVVVRQLKSDPLYPPLFRAAFGDSTVTQERIAKALAQFIRSIVSCRSRYDSGRAAVSSIGEPFPNFTDQENYGKQQFLQRGGCAVCHLEDGSGPETNAASHRQSEFRSVAAARIGFRTPSNDSRPEHPANRQSAFFMLSRPAVNGIDGEVEGNDAGVGGNTMRTDDTGAFKVPSLRNIAVTGPYMHDGRFTTIDRVIEHYNWSVRPHPNLDPRLAEIAANGLALPEREKVALAKFLHTLTDEELLKDPRFSDPFVRAAR